MTKTASDVIHHALRKLNIIGAGEQADADTYAMALDEYTTFHEWLMRDNERVFKGTRGRWSPGSVPDEVYTNVAAMFTREIVHTFPASDGKKAAIMDDATRAHGRLREWLQRDRRPSRYPDMISADQNLSGYWNRG
jgi:hypothetical protein